MAIGKVIVGTYGVMAEFSGSEELVRAAQAAQEAAYTEMDAYAPFPVHGLHEAVGMHSTRLPLIVLSGGSIGGLGGFLLSRYANGISYPLNIGGRPYNRRLPWSPVTLACTVLSA